MKSPMNYTQAGFPDCQACNEHNQHENGLCYKKKCIEELKHIIAYGSATAFLDDRHQFKTFDQLNASTHETCFSRLIDSGLDILNPIINQAASYMTKYLSAGIIEELITAYDARQNNSMYQIRRGTIAAVAAGFIAFCNDADISAITNWLNENDALYPDLYEYAAKIKKREAYIHPLTANNLLSISLINQCHITRCIDSRIRHVEVNSPCSWAHIHANTYAAGMNKKYFAHYWLNGLLDKIYRVHYIEDYSNN